MGKDMALIPVEDGKYDYEWVDPADPRACEVKSIEVLKTVGERAGTTSVNENLLIVGDCGDALRSLGTIPEWAARYRGKVKLVYIDPPFNTGAQRQRQRDPLSAVIGFRPLVAIWRCPLMAAGRSQRSPTSRFESEVHRHSAACARRTDRPVSDPLREVAPINRTPREILSALDDERGRMLVRWSHARVRVRVQSSHATRTRLPPSFEQHRRHRADTT